jgi:CRISPR-associated endonuclease/helicase Cas3
MFTRLVKVAGALFGTADIVLAHGKARFNPTFIELKKNALSASVQTAVEEREAGIQCTRWLGESRKLVFLGSIGVCTVDQVLVSVLPVRHRFVRGFGLGKSVLIVDEVHAYDSYMYGLLEEVIRQQKAMRGSLILLSATLPQHQRDSLIRAWSGTAEALPSSAAYPLVSWVGEAAPALYPLPEAELLRLTALPSRQVEVTCLASSDMLPDEILLNEIVQAAEAGANVVVICNLVADAQAVYEKLVKRRDTLTVDLFHSRFRFKDRQDKELGVISDYGNDKNRKSGGILVATQVVEQSLDIDFDWMVTQLCPMDLFFQRLGRLHRHQRQRPDGFARPRCSVLIPAEQNYALHKLVYGNDKAPNSRVLWRTEQLLQQHPQREFPKVYRPLIEAVYVGEPWDSEPPEITKEYEEFKDAECISRNLARQITDLSRLWDDNDSNVGLLTREGELSLNVVPVVDTPDGRCFLDGGMPITGLDEWRRMEMIMLNTVSAPASWAKKKGMPVA